MMMLIQWLCRQKLYFKYCFSSSDGVEDETALKCSNYIKRSFSMILLWFSLGSVRSACKTKNKRKETNINIYWNLILKLFNHENQRIDLNFEFIFIVQPFWPQISFMFLLRYYIIAFCWRKCTIFSNENENSNKNSIFE